MSLVAYESSDESEEENTPKQILSVSHKNFPIVPAKKQRESVKIIIPSMKEFAEENEEVPKKKPKFQPGCGLFSLLPPPKNSTTLNKPGFVPHILKTKTEAPKVSVKQCDVSQNQPEISHKATSALSNEDLNSDISYGIANSSEEDSASAVKDFFSLEKSKEKISQNECSSFEYMPTGSSSTEQKLFTEKHSYSTEPINDLNIIQKQSFELPSNTCMNEQKEKKSMIINEQSDFSYSPYDDESCIDNDYQQGQNLDCSDELDTKELLLKDKEFLKLQGRHHEFKNIDIIDVNAADQLSDKNEWLMKSLTEESTYRPSRKKHNMPTQQQKRKHQITYLAFQAKEREMDLKNQWALNSRTRRETQAKYGF